MRISKAKRTAASLTRREVGTGELLNIAVTLADQVHKADHPSSGRLASWRERSQAALDNSDENVGSIRACQIQRGARVLDADEAFFIIDYLASSIAEDIYNTDAQLTRIAKDIKAAERAHALMDDECWPVGEAPENVEKLRAAWDRRADTIRAAVFRKHGEAEMADLLLADRVSFMDRVKNGRRKWWSRHPILEEAGCSPGLDI